MYAKSMNDIAWNIEFEFFDGGDDDGHYGVL